MSPLPVPKNCKNYHLTPCLCYYRFGDLKGALRKVVENPEDRKEVLVLMSMTKP